MIVPGDCLEAMAYMPDAAVDAIVTDLVAGIAGEHLVCADLLLAGHRAFRTDQYCPYDVAVEIGRRLIRLQVKTTRGVRTVPQRKSHREAYFWHVRRAGRNGQRTYTNHDFDLVALVALDCRRIAYLPISAMRQTVSIRAHDDPGPHSHGGKSGLTFDQCSFAVALDGFGTP